MFADSLPDAFGNIIFKKWLEMNNKSLKELSVLEQLAYVANRGMGALEYEPSKEIPAASSIDLNEVIGVLKQVLPSKGDSLQQQFNSEALLNIFKIGTSAGGARPKVLISENKDTGEILPGDLNTSADYNHYIIKLSLDEGLGYSRELIEYCYYLTATHLGITMMSSKLIDDKHFATLRFDRQHGIKQHVLTASGITGWDFKSSENSSYENLFELATFLKIPHSQIEELFKRMVFNIIFCNTDDHLKNHSFIYDNKNDSWNLSPAYDLTYSLNPLINFKRVSRALAINSKRVDISLNDMLKIADTYTIKNPKGIITEVQESIAFWQQKANELGIHAAIIQSVEKGFKVFVD
jgi:serine/threonine-protein kinase HipA